MGGRGGLLAARMPSARAGDPRDPPHPLSEGATTWTEAALPYVQLKAPGLPASPLCWAGLGRPQASEPGLTPQSRRSPTGEGGERHYGSASPVGQHHQTSRQAADLRVCGDRLGVCVVSVLTKAKEARRAKRWHAAQGWKGIPRMMRVARSAAVRTRHATGERFDMRLAQSGERARRAVTDRWDGVGAGRAACPGV